MALRWTRVSYTRCELRYEVKRLRSKLVPRDYGTTIFHIIAAKSIFVCLILIDIDECSGSNKFKVCAKVGAVCINTHGSYSCGCKKGYTGNGKQCTGNHVISQSSP